MAYEAGGGGGAGVYEINDSYIVNKPPHPDMARPTPWGGRIRRGIIQRHAPRGTGGTPMGGGTTGAFLFHFNPERINITYQMQVHDPIRQGAMDATGAPPGEIEGAYTVAFVLLLNRQFDVLEAGNRGTLHDIDVLVNLLGSGQHIDRSPVRVIFSREFSFNGIVTSMNVTHHQFTAEMIPTYSTVDLSMTNVPASMMNGVVQETPSWGQIFTPPTSNPPAPEASSNSGPSWGNIFSGGALP